MNNHKMACVFLMLFVAGLVYGTQEMRAKAKEAREASETARMEAENAELQRSIAETTLIALESDTFELRNGFKEWLPYFAAATNPQQGEQLISDVVRGGEVFILQQSFQMKEFQGDDRNALTGVLEGELNFEDEYTTTLNWLGTLEEQIPNCRITGCNIKRGDRQNNIHLKLTLEMPIMDPAIVQNFASELESPAPTPSDS